MNDGRWLIWFSPLNTNQAPLAAIESPFSKYLIGACMRLSSTKHEKGYGPFSAVTSVALNDRRCKSCWKKFQRTGRQRRRTGKKCQRTVKWRPKESDIAVACSRARLAKRATFLTREGEKTMKERGRISRCIGFCLLMVVATTMSVAGQTAPKPQKKFLSAPLLIEDQGSFF